ncbi:1338_t:CDS:2 [Diversispora eburnea]|uniref:protein-histidine N-methyltransferase n=1 Tax=Diversispora eburnea TaxID=1213867 RepID=A0A9N9ALR7_9GLOM|nr:1338_t:CDS:2 [Diversispora eburnea]
MTFRFNFLSENINTEDEVILVDEVDDNSKLPHEQTQNNNASKISSKLIPADEILITSLKDILPQSLMIERVYFSTKEEMEQTFLYKRLVTDVKFQIAQEDVLDETDQNSYSSVKIIELTAENDLVQGVYEGGLKTWECSLDLIRYLSSIIKDIDLVDKKVLELGCGSALPSIFLLSNQQFLRIDFQDYNEQVLKLVTIPNILVNTIFRSQTINSFYNDDVAELNVSNEEKCLEQVKFSRFFKGDWSRLLEVMNLQSNEEKYDIILTSETIYNSDSLPKLYNVIKNSLKRPNGVAYIAAKTIYFGVGGGILAFRHIIEQENLFEISVVYTVTEHVRREILKLSFLNSIS